MNFASLLPWHKNVVPTETAQTTAAAVDGDACAAGCGWFDSSHELHRGLLVWEHPNASSSLELPLEVQLGRWLELHLPAASPAVSARAA